MKQYKLTAWPELPPRLQKTPMRRIVSELSQRFASPRELARSSGANPRDIDDLIAWLGEAGLLMERDAPAAAATAWQRWMPLQALRGAVRAWR
jgi:hypothetical protein